MGKSTDSEGGPAGGEVTKDAFPFKGLEFAVGVALYRICFEPLCSTEAPEDPLCPEWLPAACMVTAPYRKAPLRCPFLAIAPGRSPMFVLLSASGQTRMEREKVTLLPVRPLSP